MSNQDYQFGPFRFEAPKQALTRDGEPVGLKAKACELLMVLLERRGEVLDKETLMTSLWPDTVVEENNLTVHMTALRKALGDSPSAPHYIVTIPGRGYRFVAEVRERVAEPEATEMLVAERTRTSVRVEAAEEIEGQVGEAKPYPSWLRGAIAVAAVVIIALAAVAGYWWKTSSPSAAPNGQQPQIKSLAVLPFKSLGVRQGEEYLGLGMADVMITRLSNLSQLVVRPTSSVLAFDSQDALQAGQALKVDLVLDGSIQQQGDRVRVTVRLVRVSDGQPLWAYQFDEKSADIFALQDTISGKVAEALALTLTGDERQRLMKGYTANVEAYREYLKGRFYTLQYTPDGFKKAVEHLNEAIRFDPTYALAYAGLADAYTAASDWLLPPREALAKARAASENALSLDDTLAEAHAALGHVKLHRQEPTAERELQRALELNPNSVTALLWYGEYFMAKDLTKGLAILQRAQQLDPLSPVIGSFISASYLLARRPDEAIREALKTLELDPNDRFARQLLAAGYDAKGEYDQAIAEGEKLRQSVAIPQQLGTLSRDYALSGRLDEARRVLAELERLSEHQYVSPYDIAVVHIALDEKDQAFAFLEKAYEDQSEWMGWLGVDCRLDTLRNDPRFPDLMRRAGLVN